MKVYKFTFTGTCPAVELTTDVHHPRAQCMGLLAVRNFWFSGGEKALILNSSKRIKKKRAEKVTGK